MESVREVISEVFTNPTVFHTGTHDVISRNSYLLNKQANFSFVGGTNLLSSNMNRYNQWKINFYDSFFLNNITLLGVGWWQYQNRPNIYTKFLLNSILSEDIIHSVRDSYTERMLKSVGVENVINTSCPSMWNLTKEFCRKIPKSKSESVVFTLTDYNKDYERDIQLINILKSCYDRILFWPQGSGDLDYFNELDLNKNFEILSCNLSVFTDLLENEDVDFVGTRLHAGIRALQKKKRTIIIGIDNRAIEKALDFNINVIKRENIQDLKSLISSDFVTNINIPNENIFKWKSQFK
jgi:polysaccharide pyruvyl transferase WcaK-like protein